MPSMSFIIPFIIILISGSPASSAVFELPHCLWGSSASFESGGLWASRKLWGSTASFASNFRGSTASFDASNLRGSTASFDAWGVRGSTASFDASDFRGSTASFDASGFRGSAASFRSFLEPSGVHRWNSCRSQTSEHDSLPPKL